MNTTHPVISRLTGRYPDLSPCAPDIWRAFELLETSYRQGGKLLVCGNGGSAADSEHIVGELMKGFKSRRSLSAADRGRLKDAFPENGDYLADHLQGVLPALSLVSQTSLMTAFANDVAPDMIYAQQVYGYGQKGDVVIGISTSGNAGNVVNALQVGRALDLATLGLTGQGGGKLKALCDVSVCVPRVETLEIQERHLPIYHALARCSSRRFFRSSGSICCF